MKDSAGHLIWGSEFLLVRNSGTNKKLALRFIAPENVQQWTIYIRVNVLIVTNQRQQLVDRLGEPSMEIVDAHTSFGLTTYE